MIDVRKFALRKREEICLECNRQSHLLFLTSVLVLDNILSKKRIDEECMHLLTA